MARASTNVHLFEEQERQIQELRALSSIVQAASVTFDLPMLLRLVHNALQTFMKLDAFSMVVYDSDRQIVTDGISIDEGHEYTYWSNQPPPPDSLTAWVIRNRRTLHFKNLATEIEDYEELGRHQIGSDKHAISWLGVPLLSRDGAVIGAISLQGYYPEAFSERDEAFLVNVAGQVALHVQNAQLLAQRERQIRELDAIGRIGKLISASYDFEEMLDVVYHALHEVTEASVFYLAICDPESQIVTHAIFIEQNERIALNWIGKSAASGSMTEWIMRQREPLLFQDLVAQRDRLTARGIVPRPLGPANPVRSWIGVPLLAKDGEPIGVLSLQDYQPYCYDDQTIDFLSQIASHISLGVQKVRLFEERERQIEKNAHLFAAEQEARRTADTLREVARVLSSSFDSREVLQLMLRELHNVISYDTASIMMVDRGMLRVAAYRGWDEFADYRGIALPSDRNSGAWTVARRRQPYVIPDTLLAEDWMGDPVSAHIRSWLGVPLISKGVVLGVLNIDSRHPNHFVGRDIDVAQAFANQAAVALENAQLYEESVTRVEQELEIASRIQSNLFPQTIPQVRGLEIDARCLPARETGGDFYDFVELGETATSLLGLVVGDASGKSIPGAMLMSIAHSIVRSEARDHQAPQVVMCETNYLLAQDVPSHSFVALCYATIDIQQHRLALANAGQLTPLHRHADGRTEYLEVAGPTLPLGILPDIPYQTLDVTFGAGDTLVFFTDGIVEAKNSNREIFGFERLEELVREKGDLTPHALIDQVLEEINDFMDGTPQHDDMTIVVLRVK